MGHSAGSIFLTGVIEQLQAAGIRVESLTYLAAAIRTDEWMRNVLPLLKQGDIKRFTAFGMNAARELDDVCGTGRSRSTASRCSTWSPGHSRGLTDPDETEVPLVGMAHFAEDDVGYVVRRAVDSVGGTLVWAPSSKPRHCGRTPRRTAASTTTAPP